MARLDYSFRGEERARRCRDKILRECSSDNRSMVVQRKAMEPADVCFSFISVTTR